MKGKRKALLLVVSSLFAGLFSCSQEGTEPPSILSRNIVLDYGQHVSDRVTELFGGAIIPTEIREKAGTPLIAGDEVRVSFTGEWLEQETYPSTIVMKDVQIQSVEVTHLPIVECVLAVVPCGGEISLLPMSHDILLGSFLTSYVIHLDGSFNDLNDESVGKQVYAVSQDGDVLAIYDYDPLTVR